MSDFQNPILKWPGEHSSALSITFDDGNPSQLKNAVPVLDRYDFKATFYINPSGDTWQERLQPWKAVSENGHEIGNHSLSHTCSMNFARNGAEAPTGLERMSLGEIERDILAAEERLVSLFPRERSYCYPCYLDYVGCGATRQSYVPVVARHFLAGRGCGEMGYNNPLYCDLSYLWSWRAENLTQCDLIGITESYAPLGNWQIFTFHGIGDGGRLDVSAYDFTRFVEHLDSRRNSIWVAPVIEIARYIAEGRRALNLRA